MRKKIALLLTCALFIATPVLFTNRDFVSAKTGNDNAGEIKDELLHKIIDLNQSYSDLDVSIVSDDFDADGTDEFFYVFENEGSSKDDFINYSVDIWFGSKSEVSQVVEGGYILPNTFGSMKLAGKKYFRYDLSYATSSQTVLLSVKNNKCTRAFLAPGSADFKEKSNDFTVISDAYDLLYVKADKLSCGHTWKPYYFFADSKGIHEYGAVKISKKDFQKYSKADQILKTIKTKLSKKNTKITYQFLKRSNGLIHINIISETKAEISHTYQTYQIGKKNTLKLLDSGDGNYLTAQRKAIAVYKR